MFRWWRRLEEPDIDPKIKLYVTQQKLKSAESTLRWFMGSVSLFLAAAAIISGFYTVYNVRESKRDLVETQHTLWVNSRAAMQENTRRMDELTSLVKERNAFWNEQIQQALREAKILRGTPKIECYYDKNKLDGFAIPVKFRGYEPFEIGNVRILNDGDGTTTEISIELFIGKGRFVGHGDGDVVKSVEDGYDWMYSKQTGMKLDGGLSMVVKIPAIYRDASGDPEFMLRVYYGQSAPSTTLFSADIE